MTEEEMIFEEVALRKESVDRNIQTLTLPMERLMSLSARRAWIEMIFPLFQLNLQRLVALRKESVDRNFLLRRQGRRLGGRSPQGERG